MADGGRQFAERFEDEAAALHVRVGQDEARRARHGVVQQEQVDVDGAVVVHAVAALLRAAQGALHVLRGIEQFAGRQRGVEGGHSVEEAVGRGKAYGFRFIKRRAPGAGADAPAECPYGGFYVSFPVAGVGAESYVESHVSQSTMSITSP